MKRKNLLLSLFCLGILTMSSITFISCGDDKEENKDEYKPVLSGEYRTPYIHDEKTFWVGATGTSGSDTGHYATCKSFSSYVFSNDGKATFYTYHHKSCVSEHKMDNTNNVIWNSVLDSKGNTLDWYVEGNGNTLSYTIDYEKNIVTLSNGTRYYLKSTGKTVFENLLDDKGNAQYVLGNCSDEKYNNINYFSWIGTLK